MGSYLTSAEIITYTGTALTTAELDAMILDAEGEMEDLCEAQGALASTSSPLCKAAVIALVKAKILERGIFDGGLLKAMDRTQFRDDMTPEYYEQAAQRKIDTYVVLAGGGEASSSANIEETWVRSDHEMPSYNLDQNKIKEYHDKASETSNQDTDEGT